MGTIFAVGIGAGNKEKMTMEAAWAIEQADIVVAYTTYAALLAAAFPGKTVEATGMRQEEARAARAVALAKGGKTVALVSSGDAGIYGMTPLIYEMAGVAHYGIDC